MNAVRERDLPFLEAMTSDMPNDGDDSVSDPNSMLMRGQSTYEELDLALDPDVDQLGGSMARRAWKRSPVVRMVEYSPYPRCDASQHSAVGFTANESRGGLCMLARETHDVGASLRVTVREVDGRARLEAIARVAWCNPEAGDRVALGLELLEVRTGAEPHGEPVPGGETRVE